jgi:tRNA threonylcarbamoyladenosine modification (KEOPS) complex  Pcc1 subunit
MASYPLWAKTLVEKQDEHTEILADHSKRIETLETVANDLTEIKEAIASIGRWIKGSVPAVISAAIAAGLVNGKLGAFLNALFVGH